VEKRLKLSTMFSYYTTIDELNLSKLFIFFGFIDGFNWLLNSLMLWQHQSKWHMFFRKVTIQKPCNF